MIRIFSTFECHGKVVAEPLTNKYWNVVERYFRIVPEKWEYGAKVEAQAHLLINPIELEGHEIDFVLPRKEDLAQELEVINNGVHLIVKGYIGIDERLIDEAKPDYLLYLATDVQLYTPG